MTLARRSGIALAIAGSALTLAASTPRAVHTFSPGYTYRLLINSQVTKPDGKTENYVVMSGRAMVNAHGGRLDVDESAKQHGSMAEKGGYILYDPTSMTIVSPKDKQAIRFGFDDIEKGMGSLAGGVPGMKLTVSDVSVNLEKLGAGEPLLGMATTHYRVTQDYKIAMKVAFMNRSSTEHVVQEYWMADQKAGLANPFAKMSAVRIGGGAFEELITKTTEASKAMGRGIPLKTVTTSTSTSNKGEKTQTVSTMLVTELKSGDVDDASFKVPSDYAVTDMGAQMKAMGDQLQQAKAANAAEAAQAGSAQSATQTDSTPDMKAAAAEAAKEAAKQGAANKVKKGLGGLLHRP